MQILVHIFSSIPPSKNKAIPPLLNHVGLVQSVHMSFLFMILLFPVSPSQTALKRQNSVMLLVIFMLIGNLKTCRLCVHLCSLRLQLSVSDHRGLALRPWQCVSRIPVRCHYNMACVCCMIIYSNSYRRQGGC